MAEESGAEKSLPASGMKRQKARMEGNVAKSQDLSAAFALLAAMATLMVMGQLVFRDIIEMGAYYIGNADRLTLAHVSNHALIVRASLDTFFLVLPFAVVMVITGIVLNYAQVGVLFTAQPLTPKPERINPISGLKRFFSLRTLVELVKSLAKLGVVGAIVYFAMRDRWDEVILLIHATPETLVPPVAELVLAVWWRIAAAMLVLGMVDYAYQRWQHDKDLRMTPQEAKQEAKELEGDPQVKRRVKQLQREMAMQRMMGEVPEAEVVVTNPTHYAVALRYDAQTMEAPIVVAKGARIMAQRIREAAAANDVPIVQRPELARTLYANVELEQAVPGDLYRVVAEVLSFVYQIDRREQKQRERADTPAARMAG